MHALPETISEMKTFQSCKSFKAGAGCLQTSTTVGAALAATRHEAPHPLLAVQSRHGCRVHTVI